MPQTYIQQSDLSADPVFVHRATVAACKSAINIQAEATATPNHTNRANYAKLVLNAPSSYGPLFALAILSSDLTLAGGATDAQLSTGTDSVFNALAGTI